MSTRGPNEPHGWMPVGLGTGVRNGDATGGHKKEKVLVLFASVFEFMLFWSHLLLFGIIIYIQTVAELDMVCVWRPVVWPAVLILVNGFIRFSVSSIISRYVQTVCGGGGNGVVTFLPLVMWNPPEVRHTGDVCFGHCFTRPLSVLSSSKYSFNKEENCNWD